MSRTDADDPADDAEALSWAGDEERGGFGTRPRREDPAAGGEEREATAEPEPIPATAFPHSAARTAATAVFAVLYLAIVLGWVLSVQRTASGSGDVFVEITWQFGEFMAMVAGALWFGAVYTLTRASRTLLRVGWWALGVGVLVPWPIVFVFTAEAAL